MAADEANGSASDAVSVTAADDCATLVVRGLLHQSAGARLLEMVAVAVGWAARVEVDLLEVTGSTVEGEAALVACRDIPYDGTLVFRTDGGPGGDALLAAFAAAEMESAAQGLAADGVEAAPA
jgi:hypothetical protein